MTLKFFDRIINTIIIYIIIILAKKSDAEAWNNINKKLINRLSDFFTLFASTRAMVLFPLTLLSKIGFTFSQNFILPFMSKILKSL